MPRQSSVPLAALRAAAVVLLAVLLGGLSVARAEEPQATPTPTAEPQRPVSESVDRAVGLVEQTKDTVCEQAQKEGRPCFPAEVEAKKHTDFEGALKRELGDELRPKGPPAPDPLGLPHVVPTPFVGGISFDPVCAVQSLFRQIKGASDTFYLYRVKGPLGEYIELRDHPVDLEKDPHAAPAEMELLGQYGGPCAAVAAYWQAQRDLLARKRP